MNSRYLNFFKKAAKLICFILILGLVLWGLSRLLGSKISRDNKRQYFDEVTQMDVLFAGSSHTHNNILPMDLYKDYGITSYNAGSAGESVEVTYYVVKEFFARKVPRVLVVDMFQVHAREKGFDQDQGLLHTSMDFMPLDRDKIELAGKAAEKNNVSPLAFLSNLYAYHNRWQELTKQDFVYAGNPEMGAEVLGRIEPQKRPEIYHDPYDDAALEGVGYEYMKKILALCKENGVSCVFINVPYSGSSRKRQLIEYSCMNAIEGEGAYTLDLNEAIDDMGLDFSMDYADEGHLNVIGCRKMTDYIGNYLKDTFSLEDRREDPAFSDWNEKLKLYTQEKLIKASGNCEDASSFCSFAYGEDALQLVIYAASDPGAEETLPRLLKVLDVGIASPEAMPENVKGELLAEYGQEELTQEQLFALYLDPQTGQILKSGLFTKAKGRYVKAVN